MMFEHDAVNRIPSRIPYGILIPLFMIIGIGVLNLSSAAQATRPDLYLSQVMRLGLALILLMSAAFIRTALIRELSFLAFGAALVLLILVLLVGHTAKGAERWLVLGAFRMQPSDPAKLALVLAMARYCSLMRPIHGYTILSLVRPLNITRPIGFLLLMVFLLTKSRHGTAIFSNKLLTSHIGVAVMGLLLIAGVIWLILALVKLYQDRFSFAGLVAPIDIPLAPAFLICVQPDLGTGLIVLAIASIMFLYVGIKRSSLAIGVISALFFCIVAYYTVLMDYQKQRIVSFLNPDADVRGEGYQAMQSIIAIGSGRLTGKGYSGGTQTQLSFLPENATDFVFSVWAEEWGFLASIFLLGLYFILLGAIIKTTAKVEDQFCQLICIGVAAFIFLHVFINVGMVTGLMPVVGVPLPLMSFGGSSLNITLVGIGLVINVALWRGEK